MRKWSRLGIIPIFLLSATGSLGQGSDNGAKISSTMEAVKATPTTSSSTATHSAIIPTYGNGTCPSRTANYITHRLPQQCLRTDRASMARNATSSDAHAQSPETSLAADDAALLLKGSTNQTIGSEVASTTSLSPGESPTSTSTTFNSAEAVATPQGNVQESDSPFDNTNFLSFEEWKKQNQPKVESNQGRNVPVNGDRQRPGITNALDSLGDEGEIDLDFSGFGGSPQGPSQPRAAYRKQDDASPQDVPKSQTPKSKDAGKTCKERTNYASFDCSAQVLKHNPECKSASSVLVENKDSYMLNTCSAQNKFLIVELCNDVLVDTVVLANYEFFSSIFRQFRVSVSDRYPVKMDKWRELGTFEARNTREIQAFLVERPQLFARYLRVEFLTHYGSEYYCPISLLRVHGTNMLEDVRTQDDSGSAENSEDEDVAQSDAETTIATSSELSTTTTASSDGSPSINIDLKSGHVLVDTASSGDPNVHGATISATSPSSDLTGHNATIDILSPTGRERSQMTCSSNLSSVPLELTPSTSPLSLLTSETSTPTKDIADFSPKSDSDPPDSNIDTTTAKPSSSQAAGSHASNTATASAIETASNATVLDKTDNNTSNTSPSVLSSSAAALNTGSHQVSSSTNTSRTIAASTSSTVASPQPSTQESFFKSLSRRLQQLESNSTLSLQYIEEQSRILRDAFSKVEKRQISSTTTFLTNLNDTVMTELRGFRQAYDQLWQSTVLELEGQREQYQREMLAMSSRLTLVADELLWQKRMGIVQSSLILLCLGLVLFARTGLQGYLEVPLMQQMMNKSSAALGRAGWESPPASPSPENRSPVALFRRKLWRATSEPSALANEHVMDGEVTGTDSRPDTRDGPNVDVFVEPPTPPSSRGVDSVTSEVFDDDNGDDEEEVLDPRESQSGPATPTGTRDILNKEIVFEHAVIDSGVG